MLARLAATVVVLALAACGRRSPTGSDGPALTSDTSGAPDGAACAASDAAAVLDARGAACTAGGIPGSCIDVASCRGARSSTAGACAGAANIECCTPRFAADITCDPNAAPQPNACLVEEPGDAGCPAGMARVDTFCVDRFEAALVDAATGAPWSPYIDPGRANVRAVSLRNAVPQGYIAQTAASAACVAAGKQLCSDAQWLRACQGPAATTYPYGATREPGVCNDARAVHPAVELYGTSDSWIFAHLDSPCLDQEAAGLARSGAHAGCVTAEGVFDMMGNLHEWTAATAGTFRGGYYVDTVENGPGCLYATTAHDTAYADYSTGFRCCAAAQR